KPVDGYGTIQRRRFSRPIQRQSIQRQPIQRQPIQRRQFSASQFSTGRFSTSLNDFDLKKSDLFSKKIMFSEQQYNWSILAQDIVLQKYSTLMGYWGFKPTYIGKNTSKETLKCHFMHLGLRVPPATTMGYWGFEAIANCKNT
ncbi:Hypothetical protein FKW44_008822, partial [Caligus rogercresseyi]